MSPPTAPVMPPLGTGEHAQSGPRLGAVAPESVPPIAACFARAQAARALLCMLESWSLALEVVGERSSAGTFRGENAPHLEFGLWPLELVDRFDPDVALARLIDMMRPNDQEKLIINCTTQISE
jgi:hypothetical protein